MTGTIRAALVLLVAGVLASLPAAAHFQLNQNVRIFHVVHTDEGLDVYVRTPMAYLVAGLSGRADASGLPAPAPFTTNGFEDGRVMHWLDPDAVRRDPLGLGRIAARTLRLEAGDGPLVGEVEALRVHVIGHEPGFATPAEAIEALSNDGVYGADAPAPYVGDVMVDIRLSVTTRRPVHAYTIAMLADPRLPGQEETANIVLDHSPQGTQTFRATGLMREPLTISSSPVAAASTFVVEGIHHILGGLDHLLFVLCLVVGAAGLRSLVGRITGFTIGHTVTLTAGFFGLAPKGAWFIPAIEIAIALSIVVAAAMVILRPDRNAVDIRGIAITAAIGLLHGFGFSFMLRDILRVDASNVWQCLLAFNLGVEIGQLLVVALVWPVVMLLSRVSDPTWRATRTAVASSAGVVAVMWVVDRAGVFL